MITFHNDVRALSTDAERISPPGMHQADIIIVSHPYGLPMRAAIKDFIFVIRDLLTRQYVEQPLPLERYASGGHYLILNLLLVQVLLCFREIGIMHGLLWIVVAVA
jgi:hypothetical protein